MPYTIPYTTWRWQLRPDRPNWATPAPAWVQKGTVIRVVDAEQSREFDTIVQKQSSIRDRGLGSSNL
jgi:hypothetical protein